MSTSQPLHTLVTIGMGGNVGDRLATLRSAYKAIGNLGLPHRVSPLYETVALIAPGRFSLTAPRYLNAILQLHSLLPPQKLMEELLAIERYHHRTREENVRWGPRTLDLDMVSYGALRMDTQALTLPHPEMHRRAFVLQPLCDIDPDWRHPVFEKTATELLSALPPEEHAPYRIPETHVIS